MKSKQYVDFDDQKKFILGVLRFYDYKSISFYDRIKGDTSWIVACDLLNGYKVVCELEMITHGKMEQEAFNRFMEAVAPFYRR